MFGKKSKNKKDGSVNNQVYGTQNQPQEQMTTANYMSSQMNMQNLSPKERKKLEKKLNRKSKMAEKLDMYDMILSNIIAGS